ncbi:hypothetical protein ACFFQW_37090 [Umezawaea endophytica]|uniref:Uncharacterized protein n=1 Tax=Umezawaea endophytica TaxID=1654476 RepID=A0A9X2VW71_9PSEU|nr:hypothetical protein [Umezawaea endophytica]MCS7483322.1 hypothetical protein [Umezawaea endophytica]
MDIPEQDGDDSIFAGLESVGDERPTSEARLRIEKGELTVDVSVPSSHASQFLEAATAALLVIGALVAPMLTLTAAPEGLPHWATVVMITVQLGILIWVSVNIFTGQAVLRRRPTG